MSNLMSLHEQIYLELESENRNKKSKNPIDILEDLKQEDYELWIRTQGKSHLSEEQWDWVIENFKQKMEKNNG